DDDEVHVDAGGAARWASLDPAARTLKAHSARPGRLVTAVPVLAVVGDWTISADLEGGVVHAYAAAQSDDECAVGDGEEEVRLLSVVADEFHTCLDECRDECPCLVGRDGEVAVMADQVLVLGQRFSRGGWQLGRVGGHWIGESEVVV